MYRRKPVIMTLTIKFSILCHDSRCLWIISEDFLETDMILTNLLVDMRDYPVLWDVSFTEQVVPYEVITRIDDSANVRP